MEALRYLARRAAFFRIACCVISVSAMIVGLRLVWQRPAAAAQDEMEPPFSTFLCKGTTASQGRERYCHFRNVCIVQPAGNASAALEMYVPSDWEDRAAWFDNATGFTPFPAGYVGANRGDSGYEPIEIVVRRGESRPPGAFSASPHVYLAPFWPEGFGHFLMDDLWSAFSLALQFGLPLDDLQLVLHGRGCASVHVGRELERCERFFSQWLPGIARRPALAVASERRVCARDLLLGTRPFWFHLGRNVGRDHKLFRDAFLRNFGFDPRALPPRHRIAVVRKGGGHHSRDIVNFDEVARRLAERFAPIEVAVLDVAAMAPREQIAAAQSATVLVTPEGSVSFLALFLPDRSAAIFFDHWDPVHRGSVHMESYLWQHCSWIRDMYYPVRREEVSPVGTGWRSEALALRDSFAFSVDSQRLAALVDSALRSVDDDRGWRRLRDETERA